MEILQIREKANHIEMSQTLKSEIADLHGMLNAMESSTRDAEIRHTSMLDFLKQESSLLKEDLDKAKGDLKSAKETNLNLKKEITEMHEEAAGLRAQLQDALNDARLYQQNADDCVHANKQLRQAILEAQENIASLIKVKNEAEILYLQRQQDYQMEWEMERTRLLDTANRDAEEKIAELAKKNCTLKKRLKQSYQVLAVMTHDCRRLKDKLKGKAMLWKEEERVLEKDPAKNLPSGEGDSTNCGPSERGRTALHYESKVWPLHREMSSLAQRQLKVLDSLAAT